MTLTKAENYGTLNITVPPFDTSMNTPSVELEQSPKLKGDRPIIFFDGECVMCNSFVDLMLRLDPQGYILMAPLQGKTAKEYLPPMPEDRKVWTIYYLDETGLYARSDAFVRICQRLNNWASIFAMTKIFPLPLRDGFYNVIAQNRYRLFGRQATCRVPSATEQMHFLP